MSSLLVLIEFMTGDIVSHVDTQIQTVSDQIQSLQNCYTTPNKNASKDDV
jgi:hypothetical protein